MSWTPPNTEDQWSECLSAYLDGELAFDEASAVERHLESDPRRTLQLAALRSTRSALCEWQIESCEPDTAFLHALNEATTRIPSAAAPSDGHTRVFLRILRWPAAAAVFAGGVLCGVYGTLSVHRDTPPHEAAPVEITPPVRAAGMALASAISPAQAQALFREMEAEKVKEQIVGQLRNRDWKSAAALRQKLQDEYADTRVSATLAGNRSMELLDKALETTRRAEP